MVSSEIGSGIRTASRTQRPVDTDTTNALLTHCTCTNISLTYMYRLLGYLWQDVRYLYGEVGDRSAKHLLLLSISYLLIALRTTAQPLDRWFGSLLRDGSSES